MDVNHAFCAILNLQRCEFFTEMVDKTDV